MSTLLPPGVHPVPDRRTTLGATVTLEALNRDPYPIFARLRATEPVSWIEHLSMWYVTRYDDVQTVLTDPERFTTHFEQSIVFDTFGLNMLTSDGIAHRRQRAPFRGAFAPVAIRNRMEAAVRDNAMRLLNVIARRGRAELRHEFAARLPILSMLNLFGLPEDEEAQLRQWYDSFERALANFRGDEALRNAARISVGQFGEFLQRHMDSFKGRKASGLLADVVNDRSDEKLTDGEIQRNSLVIFFGGISTVEALILNSLYALVAHPDVLARVRAHRHLIPSVLDEVMRWLSPVQSAVRHATVDSRLRDIEVRRGDTLSCMLGAANRDPEVFADPDRFDIDRPNSRKHLGFAYGPHACLGLHLAKFEAAIALETFLSKVEGMELCVEDGIVIEGHEFRRPRRLELSWQARCQPGGI
jgi:cytochrome P450